MATAITALANTTLASAAASVTFSGIPATYRDLRIVVNAATATEGNITIQVNGDTGSNYSQVNMRGFGTTSVASSSATVTAIASNYSTGLQTSGRAINVYDLMDYSTTDKQKTMLIRANHPDEIDAIAGRWANTAAITSVTISGSANFTTGSTFSLYAIAS